jgi:hypothetical protein
LELGTVAETIEVVAGAQLELQTMDASVGTVMDRKMLDNIPSLARDATALLLLQPLASPGFNSPGSPNATGEGDNTGGQIAGARSDQNTFRSKVLRSSASSPPTLAQAFRAPLAAKCRWSRGAAATPGTARSMSTCKMTY